MNFNYFALGIDIEENERFKNKTLENDEKFLRKIFTQQELEYCFSNNLPYPHLCARFCAKEAVVKALTDLNITDVFYSDIEVLKKNNNVPYVEIKKYPYLKFKLSLSHSKNYSVANVIVYKEET